MTLDSIEAKEAIKKYAEQNVKPVGILSLLYQLHGLTGIRFEEALKIVRKEIQRCDSVTN